MARETTKAMRRRKREEADGGFAWSKVLAGKGIDVGAGPDCLPGCQPFDLEHGDANRLDEYFPENHFDYLSASHCLEHCHDPRQTILRWIRVVKPGGHLVVAVPDIGAFERFQYPSRWNPDHKSGWSMVYEGSAFPIHIKIPQFLKELESYTETLLARYVEENYNWKLGMSVDQTWNEENGVEIFNEFVLKKHALEK